jgi:hypothetical protein
MSERRIGWLELVPGELAHCDLFDAKHRPMLQRGQPLPICAQLGRWIEEGLFAETGAAQLSSAAPDQPASVLRMLNRSSLQLDCLLSQLRSVDNAEATLRAIAVQVMQAIELNADIALAAILLSQISGTYPVRHCVEAALVANLVAQAMQKPPSQVQAITAAALTMNLAMLGDQERFQCSCAALSQQDMAIVRRHPDDGAALLQYAGVHDQEWLSCVRQHHRNADGSGYGAGDMIEAGQHSTQNANLIGLADRYCALISARNYRRSMLPDAALRTLFSEQLADADLTGPFLSQLGQYPPGTLVRLQSGETAVIASRSRTGIGMQGSVVHVLRDADGRRVNEQRLHDAADTAHAIVQALHEEQAAIHFSMQLVWGKQASL